MARGKTNYCASHGGGDRCAFEGCEKLAIGKTMSCRAHNGQVSSQYCATLSTAGEQSTKRDLDHTTFDIELCHADNR